MKEKCPNANIFLAFCHRGVSIMFSIMIRVLFNGEGVSKCQLWSLQHKEQIYIRNTFINRLIHGSRWRQRTTENSGCAVLRPCISHEWDAHSCCLCTPCLPCAISSDSITSRVCVPPGIPQFPTVPQTDCRVCSLRWSEALQAHSEGHLFSTLSRCENLSWMSVCVFVCVLWWSGDLCRVTWWLPAEIPSL